MKFPFGWIALLSLGAALYLFFFYNPNNLPECGEGCYAVKSGEEWVLSTRSGFKSVQGLSETQVAGGTMLVEGAKYELKTNIYNEGEDFSEGLKRVGLSFKGVSLSSVNDFFTIKLGYVIPDDEKLVGKTAEIVTQVLVRYPKLDQSDDVVTRSINKDLTYTIKKEWIDFTVKVLIVPSAPSKRSYHRLVALGLLIFFVFCWYMWAKAMQENNPDQEDGQVQV